MIYVNQHDSRCALNRFQIGLKDVVELIDQFQNKIWTSVSTTFSLLIRYFELYI